MVRPCVSMGKTPICSFKYYSLTLNIMQTRYDILMFVTRTKKTRKISIHEFFINRFLKMHSVSASNAHHAHVCMQVSVLSALETNKTKNHILRQRELDVLLSSITLCLLLSFKLPLDSFFIFFFFFPTKEFREKI